jgi:DNA invertase Pin-like site-specific DNA recombinase
MNAQSNTLAGSRTKHFVGLIRVSTQKQAEDVNNMSLEVQEDRIRGYVGNVRGATLSVHTEIGSASKSSTPRLVFQTAIQEVKDTKGILVVVRIDRLARNSEVIPLLKGVKVYSLDEGPMSQNRLADLLTEAEREAKAISVGSKSSADRRRARGEKLGNRKTLDLAQRNGCASRMARAARKIADLSDILRSNASLIHLTHADLSHHLNAIGALNHHKAGQFIPWTKGAIRKPREAAMRLLNLPPVE